MLKLLNVTIEPDELDLVDIIQYLPDSIGKDVIKNSDGKLIRSVVIKDTLGACSERVWILQPPVSANNEQEVVAKTPFGIEVDANTFVLPKGKYTAELYVSSFAEEHRWYIMLTRKYFLLCVSVCVVLFDDCYSICLTHCVPLLYFR